MSDLRPGASASGDRRVEAVAVQFELRAEEKGSGGNGAAVWRTYGVPTVALRYFNIYGTRQALSNPYTGVAAIFASRLLNHRAPMVFEDARQMRDFVSVHDMVQANLLAMERKADGMALNIGSGEPVNVREGSINA